MPITVDDLSRATTCQAHSLAGLCERSCNGRGAFILLAEGGAWGLVVCEKCAHDPDMLRRADLAYRVPKERR